MSNPCLRDRAFESLWIVLLRLCDCPALTMKYCLIMEPPYLVPMVAALMPHAVSVESTQSISSSGAWNMIKIKSNMLSTCRTDCGFCVLYGTLFFYFCSSRYIIQSIFELSLVKSNLISDFDIHNYIWQGMYNQYNEILNILYLVWNTHYWEKISK